MKKRKLSYQIDAAKIAIQHLKDNESFKLQSPTGSGKTMIMGQIIEDLNSSRDFQLIKKTYIFIAPSVGSLDHQGYEKISSYLSRGWLKGFETEYIGTQGSKKKSGQYLENIEKFEENKVYFIGWSLFGKNSNISKIDSEKNDIQRVIQNTKENNTKIILIIDEAHREVITKSENKQIILNEMKPFRTIEISATLDDPDYKVTIQHVRNEKAIKKNVVLDMGIPQKGEFDKPGEINDLVNAAIKKQSEIKKAYSKRKIDSNPLILIQIPDKSKTKIASLGKRIDDYYLEETKRALESSTLIKYKEGLNYAIWLDKHKTTTKEELIRDNSPYDVLIFKQAIATGWDIPRANILVRLREPVSSKFDIQTLGRILRNPRFNYFDNYLIDNAFVFTRDNKYYQKISKESFVVSKDKIKISLSPYGKENELSINKVVYDKPIVDDEVIENVYKELIVNKDKLIKVIKNVNEVKISHRPVTEIDAGSALNESPEVIEADTKRNKHHKDQQSIDMFVDTNDMSLFEIYISYISSFSNKTISFEAFDKFVQYLSTNNIFKKKEVYKKIASDDIKNPKKLLDDLNIFEWLDSLKDKAIKKLSSKNTVKYNLPITMSYPEDSINKNNWDEANTYDLALKKFDSSVEKEFYPLLKSLVKDQAPTIKSNKKLHVFRNNIDGDSYFVEYYDNNDKLNKFFPDFILIDDFNKKAYILETKGRRATNKNIDVNSNAKLKSTIENIADMHDKYKVIPYFVEPSPNGFSLYNLDEGDMKTWSKFIMEITTDITRKNTFDELKKINKNQEA